MKEKYDFEAYEYWPDLHRNNTLGYCYTIYRKNTKIIAKQSQEYFDTKQQAEFAAIKHMYQLEKE